MDSETQQEKKLFDALLLKEGDIFSNVQDATIELLILDTIKSVENSDPSIVIQTVATMTPVSELHRVYRQLLSDDRISHDQLGNLYIKE